MMDPFVILARAPTHDLDAPNLSAILTTQPTTGLIHHTGIAKLPSELLAEIFEYCAVNDSDVPLRLGRVSKEWKDIAVSFPRVWQSLELRDESLLYPQDLRRKVDLWISRSNIIPFDYRIAFSSVDSLLPMLSHLIPYAHRWGQATFKGRAASRLKFGFQVDGKRPNVETLAIHLVNPDNQAMFEIMEDGDSDFDDEWAEVKEVTQDFEDKESRLSYIDITMTALPDPQHMTPLQSLTTLWIVSCDAEKSVSMHPILALLAICPNLEVFHLVNRRYGDPEACIDCKDVPVVHLPYLRELRLTMVCTTRCFLSHIFAPALSSLSLIHVNSATRATIPVMNESGDSEDEARDFSQSPWTDHATGMGLRKLFARCHPPLRFLDMDYADLRTKDFKWMFRNFTDLENLRVVASDMSDKVMQALMPDLSEKYLPLPMLSHLEFNKCQYLSGEAIEQMIDSRVEASRKGILPTLQVVKIAGCKGFSHDRYHTISRNFPRKSRFIYAPYEDD